MIVREAPDGTFILIEQEAHADVAAQFAAHWGNERFSRLDPYQSMLFATIYHDSGHREMEAALPIDVEKGVPYQFRGAPPGVRRRAADGENAEWIRERDPYASLVVTMHHAGIPRRRYDTVRTRWNGDSAPMAGGESLGVDSAFADLQGWQREVADQLRMSDMESRAALWHNYRRLQVFDLLSLYLCCDGYQGDQMREATVENVPVSYGSEQTVDLHITPTGPSSIRIDPYPFDVAPLPIAVMARRVAAHVDEPEGAAREAYHQAPRHPLTWQITGS